MELTEEKIQELLKKMADIGKDARNRVAYSNTDGVAQVVIMLGPNLEPATIPMTWKNEKEKWAKMRAISEVAKDTFCQAVVLIIDTRWIDEDGIRRLCNIPPIEEMGLKAFQEAYHKVLKEKYKGYLGNVPPQYWQEAICVLMKGPRVGTRSLMLFYTKGFDDKVRWLKEEEKPMGKVTEIQFNLIPAWWQ